jgi:hypothetical protein
MRHTPAVEGGDERAALVAAKDQAYRERKRLAGLP